MPKAVAGDIVSIAGLNNATVTYTLNEFGKNVVIPVKKMSFLSINFF